MSTPTEPVPEPEPARRKTLDPFDASVLVCLGATGCFALLLIAIARYEVVHGVVALWPIFLALSAVAWLTIDGWAPLSASGRRQRITLAVYVVLEALAVAPVVVLAWELGGLPVLLASVVATGIAFAGFTVFALVKPTIYLEPVDPFVVLGIMGLAVLLPGVGFGLPLSLLWATPLHALSAVFVLQQIANTAGYTARGQHVAGGTHLFACVSSLLVDFVYMFTAMARGEQSLWRPVVHWIEVMAG